MSVCVRLLVLHHKSQYIGATNIVAPIYQSERIRNEAVRLMREREDKTVMIVYL